MYAELRRKSATQARGRNAGPASSFGDNAASRAYVRSKDKCVASLDCTREMELPAVTTQEELLAQVVELNRDPAIHGILVHRHRRRKIDTDDRALADPAKDVDGFLRERRQACDG